MCGIAAAFGLPGFDIQPMLAAMRHRGPDDSGTYSDGRVSLGITRLAVLDTSPRGHQPMSNADQTIWIVYNGETYNFRAERKRLEGAGVSFSSDSDTEVLLKLYEAHGDDFLLRVRGMFALAIYDRRRGAGRERLLLARDPLGIKPLLYAETPGGLLFASEVKALLASAAIQPEIDPKALRQLLTFGSIPQPATFLRGVRMLPAGHRMVLEAGQRRVERYWQLGVDRMAGVRSLSYPEQTRLVREAVSESVRLQMVSDVPLGAFLSGGIDSSILVALMTRSSPGRVKTFSIGFGAEGAAMDETDDAQRMADLCGSDHERIEVTGSMVRDHIGSIARGLDQPSFDGVNAYFVSMVARRKVTVAISGTGGDELFAGYPWFRKMAEYRAMPGYLERGSAPSRLASAGLFDPLLSTLVGAHIDACRAQGGFLARYARQHQAFGAPLAARLVAPGLREDADCGLETSRDLILADELGDESTVARVTALCLRGYTQNQLLRDIDAVSMAHSLEVRVPLLDPVLADLALSLPDDAKLGLVSGNASTEHPSYLSTGAKRIFIDAFRDMLPPDLDQQPKRGFGMPFTAWLEGPLQEVLQDTLSPATIKARGLFDVQEVAAVRERFGRGAAPWTHPWLLMITELWCREVLDAAPRPMKF